MSNYTPGPWEPINDDGDICVMANGYYVATCHDAAGINSTDETWIDNARLIAAAPDLLESLQTMVKAFHTYAPKTEGAEYNCVIEARAAIAKATGN